MDGYSKGQVCLLSHVVPSLLPVATHEGPLPTTSVHSQRFQSFPGRKRNSCRDGWRYSQDVGVDHLAGRHGFPAVRTGSSSGVGEMALPANSHGGTLTYATRRPCLSEDTAVISIFFMTRRGCFMSPSARLLSVRLPPSRRPPPVALESSAPSSPLPYRQPSRCFPFALLEGCRVCVLVSPIHYRTDSASGGSGQRSAVNETGRAVGNTTGTESGRFADGEA